MFIIEILEYCIVKDLYQREEFYCNKYTDLYNIRTIEQTSFGFKRVTSEETRRKLSEAKKGKCPSNFKDMQKCRWRKIAKIVDNEIVEIIDSCAEAARSLGMEGKAFHQYIGRILKQHSKYFSKNTRYEYYTG